MRLQDIIDRIEDQDRDLCIVAKRPWQEDADAMLVRLTEDYRVPEEVLTQGYEYFLELGVALEEVLEGLLGKLSLEQRFQAIVFYAENDAFPEWLCAIRENVQ